MTIVRAAAVQISPMLFVREGTVKKVVRKIIQLSRQGVHFATFPETVVPYYPYFAFVQPSFEVGTEHLKLIAQSVTVPSVTTRAIGEACRKVGMASRDVRIVPYDRLINVADPFNRIVLNTCYWSS